MAEFSAPNTPEEFHQNFSPIKPSMDANQAFYESSRCLFCYDAPCVQACPTGIDIPLFIKQIHSHNTLGAAQTIFNSNVMGHACGKVCPTEVLCEGACVYNHQEVPPIQIGRLQAFASAKAISENHQLGRAGAPNGKRVAIVGAGPAGLSAACALRSEGFEVEIWEAKNKASGLTVHGVAPYKITNEEVLHETDWLERQFGFRVLYGKKVGSDADLAELDSRFDAVFLGVGLGATQTLNISGEDLPGVWGAVEFVEQLREKQEGLVVPARVVVLGGGNTAMDAASESARMGAQSVVLAYRRSKKDMGAYSFEYDLAKEAGVRGLFHVAPKAILGAGKVEGIRFIRTEIQNGKVREIPGSEFELPADWVIKATGQQKNTAWIQRIPGIGFRTNGCIDVNPDTFQTGNPRYFAAGDAVSGGQEVVNAVADGKKAAQAIALQIKQSKN